jgi:predicted XRE-type DNA-binding protein
MLENVTANPFAGLEDAELLLIKHQAVELIEFEMKARGITQTMLAEMSGMHQPHISEILSRKLNRFGIDRLNRILALFGRKIMLHYEIQSNSHAA